MVDQFAVAGPEGRPIAGTVRDDSISAITAFFNSGLNVHFMEAGWKHCRSLGYRVILVTVEPKPKVPL